MNFLHALDHQLLSWVETCWGNPWLDKPMLDITALGGQSVLTLVVLFAFALLCGLRRYRTAWFLVVAAVGGALLSFWLKELIERPRPILHHPLVLPHRNPSFPSGHSMASATVYLTLAMIVLPIVSEKRVRIIILAGAALVVVLVGLSRVYLGAHYLTDVLAGWTFGLCWALGCRWVEARWVLKRVRSEG